ncbi:immunoglobulin-like domain-containing protein [Enterococcus faecium]|uniref:immunoglobulin-like domain-containing protein n=1 Tax=Enterococcus faecium TaxID=1352 RepID=UPI002D1FA2D3|nr:immunoglobulin-like domain-containing protein [Enterococcus faecium]
MLRHPKPPQNLTFEYDAEKKQVTVTADCTDGATSAKAYKDHVDSGAAYIVDGKVSKTFSNIEDGVSHIYGLSAIYGDVESETTEEEYTAIIEAKILTVDEYVPGTSTWVTGTYQGTLAEKVGLYINGERVYSVPIGQAQPPNFEYYRKDLKATDAVKVYIADKDDKELDQADVPIKQE